jgi:outer membrane protein OmpA-like peptidoglycan-associated protein
VLSAAVSPELFSPNGDGENDELFITLSAEDESGIWSWIIEIYEPSDQEAASAETLFYQMSGAGSPPSSLTWDGRSNSTARAGELVQSDSEYTYSFSATDNSGRESTLPGKITVSDIKGPELSVSFSPELFSPDGDGENDELFVTLGAKDPAGVRSWGIKIYEPSDNLFFTIESEGEPPAELTWDGRSNITGELVQSASDYTWVFSATDNLNNVSARRGSLSTDDPPPIKVDILVIRDGDRLKVQVPSIVFGANSGGFDGLAPEVIENNEYILGRIAAVLKKFETYKVQVEGHANPTSLRPSAREAREDLALSEKRARTVLNYLVSLGVDSNRLTASGAGSAHPAVPFATADGKPNRENWWKNRRVEFILIKN